MTGSVDLSVYIEGLIALGMLALVLLSILGAALVLVVLDAIGGGIVDARHDRRQRRRLTTVQPGDVAAGAERFLRDGGAA